MTLTVLITMLCTMVLVLGLCIGWLIRDADAAREQRSVKRYAEHMRRMRAAEQARAHAARMLKNI